MSPSRRGRPSPPISGAGTTAARRSRQPQHSANSALPDGGALFLVRRSGGNNRRGAEGKSENLDWGGCDGQSALWRDWGGRDGGRSLQDDRPDPGGGADGGL